jgi:8-oxo-dGTP pyrophosphatase MutT (NUDIX family)
MAAYEKEKAHFNYRVAGVVIHEGRVLLDRNTRNTYWVLPGGHPEMMEPMADALRREVMEEIGAEVEVVRLLWILENFFHKNKDIHELSFYFLMTLPPDSPLMQGDGPFYGEEGAHQLIYQWFPINEVDLVALPLYPSYLAEALMEIPDSPEHIVFHDHKKSSSQRLTIS